MNDFDYDVLQKKRIAYGARHMKRGSKSKKCALPSDRMTAAEWKRRNGEVNTYNLNQPMSWDDFKAMPLDLQQSYIDMLQNRFGATVNVIGTELFALGNGSLKAHLRRKHLKCQNFGNGHLFSVPERLIWDNWRFKRPADTDAEAAADVARPEEPKTDRETMLNMLTQAEGAPTLDKLGEDAERFFDALPDEEDSRQEFNRHGEIVEEIPDEIGEAVTEAMKIRLTDLTATFKGEFDPEKFMQWISKLPMPEGQVRIRVEVEAL